MPGCRRRAAARHFFIIHYSFFTLHSYLFRLQGINFPSCPRCTPLLFFSQRRRGAPCTVEEKKRLWCRRRWTRAPTRWSCAMWQVCASLVQTWMAYTSLSAAAGLVLVETTEARTLVLRPGGWIQGGGRGPRPWPVGRGIPKGEANRNASSFGGSLMTFWPGRKSSGVRGRGGPGGCKFAEDLRPGPQGPTKKNRVS